MSYCLNPNCTKPQNPTDSLFCLNCGSKLILRERYRALKVIGQGGFGKTFLAIDQDKPSKPHCVIKQFYPQAQGTDNAHKAAELFDREAVRLDDLGKHPQIPELLAHFTQDTHQCLVQQFIDGQNLAQILEQEGTFKEAQIRHLLNSLLPVLQFIHDRDVIHRDIKPENIIQKHDGEFFLVDFGAAKYATGTALMKTGTVIGTAEYIAPEQTRGKAVFASDLYSLGVTCIHLLTGISPFDLFDVSEDCWIWRQFLVDNPVSDEMGIVLDKSIENGTKKRYQSASEAMEVLDRKPVKKERSSPVNPPSKPISKTPAKPIISTPQPSSGKIHAPELQSFEFEIVTLKVKKSGFWSNKTSIETYKTRAQAEYFSEDLGNRITLAMIAIPGGTFMMGSPDNEERRSNSESPQHRVTVPSFYMGKYAVTQAQYKVVMGKNPSIFKGKKRPVENVSWHDANEFCTKLSQKTGKTYRLPTEAEWEYACRAGTTTPFHCGETITTEVANYDGNYTYASAPKGDYREQTTDVGSFPPNAFGLYDMPGNVWEWCADLWHDNYNGAPSDGSVWEKGGDNRSCLRGGSWYDLPLYCRSAYRFDSTRVGIVNSLGFRVVLSSGR